MAGNPPSKLAEILHAAARRMRAEFDESQAFAHRPEKGRSREGILRDFIAPRVPGHVMTAHSGEIITASGETSRQCDLILFDRSTPPLLDTAEYRIIPNECVYSVIEVKSSLDKGELLSACEALREIKAMPKTAHVPSRGVHSQYKVHGRGYWQLPTLGLIFAYGGSKITTLSEHLWEWGESHAPEECPDGVYVLGEGFLRWTSPENGLVDPYPQPGAGLIAFHPDDGEDVFFPMMLHLNILLAQASMWPLDFTAYAGQSGLGLAGRVYRPTMRPGGD